MPWWFWVGFLLLLMIGIIVIVYYMYGKKEEGFQSSSTANTGTGPENKQVFLVELQNQMMYSLAGGSYVSVFYPGSPWYSPNSFRPDGPQNWLDSSFTAPIEYVTHDTGDDICRQLGARHATLAELQDAAKNGADWCKPGFVAETDRQVYTPVQNIFNECITNIPGDYNVNNTASVVRYRDKEFSDGGSDFINDIYKFASPICYGIRPTEKTVAITVVPKLVTYVTAYSTAKLDVGTKTYFTQTSSSRIVNITDFNSNTGQQSDPRCSTLPMAYIRSMYTVPREPPANLFKTANSFAILDAAALDTQKTIMTIDILKNQSKAIADEENLTAIIDAQVPIANFNTTNTIINDLTKFAKNNMHVILSDLIENSMLAYARYAYTSATLKAQRRLNIKNYYATLLNYLLTNPVSFIQNTILNEPVYLNNMGAPTSIWTMDYLNKQKSLKSKKMTVQTAKSVVRSFYTYVTQGLTRIDIDFGANRPTCMYDSRFFSSTDGWQLKTCGATTATQNVIKSKFEASKTAVANKYGITDATQVANTYRWKPITYFGTVSDFSISEMRQSIAISIIFNFNSAIEVDRQIRVSSTFPYDLYYSPNGAGLPEYTAELKDSAWTITNKNSAYNKTHCNEPFTKNLLDLLPYQTRQFIGNWGFTRKATITNREEQVASTMSTTAMSAIASNWINGRDANNAIAECLNEQPGEGGTDGEYSYDAGQQALFTIYGTYIYPTLAKLINDYGNNKNPGTQAGNSVPTDANTILTNVTNCALGKLNTYLRGDAVYQNYARLSTMQGEILNADLSGSFFATDSDITDSSLSSRYFYQQSWIHCNPDQSTNRNTILNQMAQLFYNKKNGNAKMQTIYDVYQVGTTLYDVYFKQIDTGEISQYVSSISTLNGEYFNYRKFNLSQQELDSLELTYDKELQSLYNLQADDMMGDGKDCGIKAQFVQIQCPASVPGTARTPSQMKLSQIVVIDNTGTNVAYGIKPKVTSTYLEPYEDDTGHIYDSVRIDGVQTTNDTQLSGISARLNKTRRDMKIMSLTDGTYAPRYYPFWQNGTGVSDATGGFNLTTAELTANQYTDYESSYENGFNSSDLTAGVIGTTATAIPASITPYEYVEINLYNQYDISVIQLFYPPSNSTEITATNVTVQLFDRNHSPIKNSDYMSKTDGNVITKHFSKQAFNYNESGSTIVDFTRPGRDVSKPICPKTMYSHNRVVRFYADPVRAGPITAPDSIVFTGFSEGPDTALTFNPLYNAGFYVNTDSQYGSIMYNPVTVFDMNSVPKIALCSDPNRIQTVFKDYSLLMNTYDFIKRPDIKRLVETNQYNQNNTYVVSSLISAANIVSNGVTISSICYYTWLENEYGTVNTTDLTGGNTIKENEYLNTYTRSGVFVYSRDLQNWNSQSVIYDLSNSFIYKSEAKLGTIVTVDDGIKYTYPYSGEPEPINHQRIVYWLNRPNPIPPIGPIRIDGPYADSVILGLNTMCPGNCSNPDVINSIITDYNSRKDISVSNGGLKVSPAIIAGSTITRVSKALTNTSQSCIYEISTMGLGGATQQIQFDVMQDTSSNNNCKYKIVNMKAASQIVPTAPYLTEIYHYITDSMTPYTNTLYSAYGTLSSLLLDQTDTTKQGIVADVIQYRTDTYKAAGQVRRTPLGIINEMSTLCDASTVQATSPLIINGFLNQYRSEQPDGARNVITQILGVGMVSSLNACDFSYETAPITLGAGGTPTINMGQAQIVGLRASIVRYPNSCAYTVNPSKRLETILPIPSLSDIMNPLYIQYNFDSTTTLMGSTITSAGISSVISTVGSPFTTLEYGGQQAKFLESIDYVNCTSLYAINAISSLNIAPTSIAQNEISSCIVETAGGTKTIYTFSKPVLANMSTLAPQLYANPVSKGVTTATGQTFTAITTIPNPYNKSFNYAGTTICTANNYQSSITGLTGIVEAQAIGTGTIISTCDYKVSLDETLPFGEMYKRATFYTGTLQATTDANLHLLSLVPAKVTDSPFRYFIDARTASAILTTSAYSGGSLTPVSTTDVNTIFMATLQYLRYAWNSKFYVIDENNPPTGWKIGSINNVYILNTDTVVLDASGALFGNYGSEDIRQYANSRFFYFELRYRPTAINGLNFSLYKQYDTAPIVLATTAILKTFSTISAAQSNIIAKYVLQSSPYTLNSYNEIDKTSYPMLEINTALTTRSGNRYRFLRFSVQTARVNTAIAEITRILFFNLADAGSTYKYIDAEIVSPATAIVSDLSANYLLSDSGKRVCDVGYTQGTGSDTNICKLNSNPSRIQTYTPGSISQATPDIKFPCGIGYTYTGSVCQPDGYYQTVIQDPTLLFNPSVRTPRLRLNIGLFANTSANGYTGTSPTQTLTVRFKKLTTIDAYSFITGSPGRAPTAWTLEGSMNGLNWATIDSRSAFNYSNATQSPRTATNGELVLSFYCPGVFGLNFGTTPTTLDKYYNITKIKDSYVSQVNNYNQITTNITEGFSGNAQESVKPLPLKESFQAPLLDRRQTMEFTAPAVSLKSAYNLPMRQGAHIVDVKDTRMNVSKKARIQYLRFITIETYDSNSKFVNMSKLEFYTRKGVVPPACIKLSNSQGSRKSPKDGVNSILGSKSQRWVDYNKSEILIQFDLEILPAEPISGFKFSIPDLEGGLNACPRKWQLLGSYDKHNWKPLHNQEDPVKNPALYTMVHTFTQEI